MKNQINAYMNGVISASQIDFYDLTTEDYMQYLTWLNSLSKRYHRAQKVMAGYPILMVQGKWELADIDFYQKDLDDITKETVEISFPILRSLIHDKVCK